MTQDLRDLLREARDGLSQVWLAYSKVEGDRGSIVLTHGSLIQRIDAALSEPAPEPVAMYDAIWSEFGGSEFDDMRRKVSADQIRRLFYMFARHWASDTVSLTVYESAVHGRQELRQALRGARAAPPPASPSDARDAARYRYWANWWMHDEDCTTQIPPKVDALLGSLDLGEAFDAVIEQENKRDPLRGTPSADFPECE